MKLGRIEHVDPRTYWKNEAHDFTPPKQSWVAFSAGKPGFSDNGSFGWEEGPVLRAELYIDTGDKQRNKQAFDALAARKDEIELAFGEPLIWTRRDDIKASRIYVKKLGAVTDDEGVLREHRDWLVDRLFRIREVFAPRIKEL